MSIRLLLKGNTILEKSGAENIHQLSMKSRVSVATAYKHISHPETVKAFDTEVLISFLMNGMELSKKQVLELKLGDIFEIVEEK